MKITNHHELRNEVKLDCSEPILTDQSYKNACDINIIMSNYAKTGMLPQVNSKEPRYIDNTEIPSLEAAFNIVKEASEAFYDLPPDIRRLMDNDPQNLEEFVQNPKNARILEENGLIVKKSDPIPSDTEILTKAIQTLTEKVTPGGTNG